MRRSFIGVVAALLLALAVVMPGAVQAQGQGFVSVMHASPDAPAVDVYVNGELALSEVPFFAASPYLPLEPGTYAVAVTPAGAAIEDAVISGDVNVTEGTYVTVAAVNTLDSIEAVAFTDNLSDPAAGQTRVSLIHAVPDAPAVDVKIAGTQTIVFEGLSFKQAAEIDVPAGVYSFDVSAAGSEEVLYNTGDLRFESGWVYTLVATGQLGAGNFHVQSVIDKIQ